MNNETKTWKDWDAEHICNKIDEICRGFGVEADWSDFAGVRTFGDLCDTICVIVAWRYRDGGRLQQSYHKLRKAIAEVTGIHDGDINPETRLDDLFPRKGRRWEVRRLEDALGFRLDMLQAKRWVRVALAVGTLVSFLSILLWWWWVGLMGVVIGTIGLGTVGWFGREFRYATVDELAMELTQNGYIFVRADQGGVDPEEIARIIEETFRRELRLAPEDLRRDVEIF